MRNKQKETTYIVIVTLMCLMFALTNAQAAVWDVNDNVMMNEEHGDSLAWFYGFNVEVNKDTAAVASGHPDGARIVFLMERDTATGGWVETQALLPDDPSVYEWPVVYASFGGQLALDGDMLFVAESFVIDGSYQEAVYVFQRDAATNSWAQTQKMVGKADESLGASIAVKGHTAFIAAGRVSYILEFDVASNLWVEKQKLNYGGHIVFDGRTALVGNSVLQYNELTAQWEKVQELVFGEGPTVTDMDGDTLVVGKRAEGEWAEGAVYIYQFNTVTKQWEQSQHIVSSLPIDFGDFGAGVAVDGNTIIIAQPGFLSGEGDGGALFIYQRNIETGEWEESQVIADVRPLIVDIDGGTTLVAGSFSDEQWALATILEVRRRNLNKLIEVQPDPSSLAYSSDLTGCPSWYAGKYLFDATLTNRSEERRAPDGVPLSFLQMQIKTLTAGNQLAVDGELLVKGDRFAVSQQEGYADGILDVGESVTVPFEICLKKQRYFKFKVNIWGAIE